MINEIAWNAFKKTGSINTFLELKRLENFQYANSDSKKVNLDEYNKNEGNNNCRK